MGIKNVKFLVEPTCFLGGYQLSTGIYVVSILGLSTVPFQFYAWLDDDTEDSNVNIVQIVIISIIIT